MATEEEWKLSSISFSLMPPADLRDQDEMCVESGTLDKERLMQQFCVDIGSMPSALTSTSARDACAEGQSDGAFATLAMPPRSRTWP